MSFYDDAVLQRRCTAGPPLNKEDFKQSQAISDETGAQQTFQQIQYRFQVTRNNESNVVFKRSIFFINVPLFGRQRINALQQTVGKQQRGCTIQVSFKGFIDCRIVAEVERTFGRIQTPAFGRIYYLFDLRLDVFRIYFTCVGHISYLFDLRLDVFHIYLSTLSSRDHEKRLTSSFIDGWRLYSPLLQCLPAKRRTGVHRPPHVNRQARGLIRSSC